MILPPELVVTRKRRDKIQAAYADKMHLSLIKTLISVFEEHVKKTREELKEALADCEMLGFDYKLVRGMAYLLESFCEFQSRAVISPMRARISVFKAVGKRVIDSVEERNRVLSSVAFKYNISTYDLNRSLYGDLEDEQELSSIRKLEPTEVLKQYNFSLAIGVLVSARSLRIRYTDKDRTFERLCSDLGEVTVSGSKDSRELLIDIKSQRKGTSAQKLQKVLSFLLRKSSWSVSAVISDPGGSRKVYGFSLSYEVEGVFMEDAKPSIKIKTTPKKRLVKAKGLDIVDVELESRKLGETWSFVKAQYSEGYIDLGDLLVTPEKLESIKSAIEGTEDMLFDNLRRVLRVEGVKNPVLMLESMGYVIEWNRDRGQSLVYRVGSSKS